MPLYADLDESEELDFETDTPALYGRDDDAEADSIRSGFQLDSVLRW